MAMVVVVILLFVLVADVRLAEVAPVGRIHVLLLFFCALWARARGINMDARDSPAFAALFTAGALRRSVKVFVVNRWGAAKLDKLLGVKL